MSAPDGPVLPAVLRDDATQAFFDAAARHELLLQRSAATGRVLGPEAKACPETGRTDLEPVVASGEGSLVTWAVVRHAPVPQLADSVPYVSAVVELPEGPWLVVRLVGTDGSDLHAGQPVRARFVAPSDGEGEVLPVFAPTGQTDRP